VVLFIIWGSKGRVRSVGKGEFFCPSCKQSAPYEQMKASRYFTLYFIPLFPTETLAEWVKCSQCQSEYDSRVLQMSQHDIILITSPWKCPACENTNPADAGTCLACNQPRASLQQAPHG
jgi:zinc ribbon protein